MYLVLCCYCTVLDWTYNTRRKEKGVPSATTLLPGRGERSWIGCACCICIVMEERTEDTVSVVSFFDHLPLRNATFFGGLWLGLGIEISLAVSRANLVYLVFLV